MYDVGIIYDYVNNLISTELDAMDLANKNDRAALSNMIICEAVDCYETATETMLVSAGKFGTLTLNLCHECAVTKFRITPPRNMILKKYWYTGQKTPLNQPVEDYCE